MLQRKTFFQSISSLWCHLRRRRKSHAAKQRGNATYTVWGSSNAMREFLYVDDMADACTFLMEHEKVSNGIYNIGTGTDITIRELAELVMENVGYEGEIVLDTSKLDGTLRKLLDVSRMSALGWRTQTSLKQGLALTVAAYLAGEAVSR